MSQENVDLIRSIYDGWVRGEMGLDKFDPDISMVESQEIPGAASVRGLDAVRRYIESFARYWDDIRFEAHDYIDCGDQVVVTARLVGRGKTSGVDVTRTWTYVWTVRGHRALRMVGYAEREQALKAVGRAE
jgi:ketosteroid isomerase-like protein